MSEQQMKNAIRAILSLVGANPSLHSTLQSKGYIYSAYVSTLIVEALCREPHVSITAQNPPGGPFRFPMGPSEIYSGGLSWYEIHTQHGLWEMHLCCLCGGVSGLPHELDIVIVPDQVANNCRIHRRRPRTDEVVFLVECKNVGAIKYSVGREFIGLCYEFPCANRNEFMTQGGWRWRGRYKLGAIVATLSALPSASSAFNLVVARGLIARPYVEPSKVFNVARFQQEVVSVLRPVML